MVLQRIRAVEPAFRRFQPIAAQIPRSPSVQAHERPHEHYVQTPEHPRQGKVENLEG